MQKQKSPEEKSKPKAKRPRKEPELHKGEEATRRVEAAFRFAIRGGSTTSQKKS